MNKILQGLSIIDAARKPVKTDVIGFAPAENEVEEITVTPVAAVTPALRPFRPDGRVLKSELPGVSNEAWTQFVFAMKIAQLGAVSASNGLGMFDVRYKRLAELGLVTDVGYKRDAVTNRSVQVATWVPPLTREKFLASANAQYKVFVASMNDYFTALFNGKIDAPKDPAMTVSGALAILHKGGRGALAKWSDVNERFESWHEAGA